MAKAMDVANFLIHLRNSDEEQGQYFSLSNLKLQKLLYYCQGGHFRWDGEKLIKDKRFEAWDYGPVIEEVYKNFKKYGQNDIYGNDVEINLNNNEKETVKAIWEQLKTSHPFDLVKSTHKESPWINARKQNRIFISNDDIKEFFTIQEEEVN